MKFFVGLHQPSDARHFETAFISVGRLRRLKRTRLKVRQWIMDSQAFTTIRTYGGYPHPVEEYAAEIARWKHNGQLLAAVSQDYMCEPVMLEKTGLTIEDHQKLTIERYDALLKCNTGVYIMPVLQGYSPADYARHIDQYGDRLARGMWVGVGSICKRNSSPQSIIEVLSTIKEKRPDLRLHGFGLKLTALSDPRVRSLLETADSMAWSFSARKQGRNANDWKEARRFANKINPATTTKPELPPLRRQAPTPATRKHSPPDPQA